MNEYPSRASGHGQGGRAGRDNAPGASLLMNVVRTLTTSASEEQREYEKRQLEKGYADTAQTIQTLIHAHEIDLSECLQTFSHVSSRIQNCRERVRQVSSNISACKSLLQCKRDQLKKLWLQNAEQNKLLEILDQVAQLKSDTNAWRAALHNQHYLKAAQLLIQSSSSLDNKLKDVQGLDALRSKMGHNMDELYERILDQLYHTLYLRPCEEFAGRVLFKEQHNHELGDNAHLEIDLSQLDVALDENSCLGATEDDMPSVDQGVAIETSELSEQPVVQCLAVLTDAVVLLGRLPQAVEAVHLSMHRGIHRIIMHTVQLCHYQQQHSALKSQTAGQSASSKHNQSSQSSSVNMITPLKSLAHRSLVLCLHYLFRLLKCTMVLHRLLLKQMKRARHTYKLEDTQLFTEHMVWHEMQKSVMEWLKDVLALSPGSVTYQSSINQQQSDSNNEHHLSVYFGKKRPTVPLAARGAKKQQMFKFSQTSHSISVTQIENMENDTGQFSHLLQLSVNASSMYLDVPGANNTQFVCAPSSDNIMAVFKPLIKFANELQRKQRSVSNASQKGQQNTNAHGSNTDGNEVLTTFLYDYVKGTYLDKVQYTLKERADATLQSATSYSTVVSHEEQQHLGAPVAVLDSSARTFGLCQYVGSLIHALPPFAGQLAALWLLVLAEYRRNTQRVYEHITRSIRQPDGMEAQEWRKISAAWAVDEDISRLLKSLPNWMSLVVQPLGVKTPIGRSAILSPPTAPSTPLVESAEQIRSKNKRESEILIGNLGSQKAIADWELISDMRHMSSLAHMHESLEWFASTVRQSLQALPPATLDLLRNAQVQLTIESLPAGEEPQVETLFDALEKRLQALEEMASTCVLMLHLEVRVHCFYHLLPLARQASHVINATQSEEADARVTKLSADLQNLHKQLAPQLQNRKVRYIFEGLGHLISCIFIHSSHHINKINDNGKKQMCRNIYSLQQTLSALTGSREPDLDDARRFFELLSSGPDEILNGLVEKEPRFSQLEYQYLLALAVRSHAQYSTERGALEKRLERLKQIMNDRRQQQKAS